MKGICLAFFSLSTSEQEEVVVVVVVVVVGGGVVGCGLPLYPLHALQVSFATTGVGSLPACVCVFFVCLFFFVFWGAGGGGGCRGWWGERKQLNLPGVFTIRRRLHTSVIVRT